MSRSDVIRIAARMLGRIRTEKKAKASRINGLLGGPRCVCGHAPHDHVAYSQSEEFRSCMVRFCGCHDYRACPRKKRSKKNLENSKNNP